MIVPAVPLLAISTLAYLLGGFDTGYYLVRARTGADVRDAGSGGTGARNAGRILGRWGFAVVFAADALKGVLAVEAAALAGLGRTGMALAMIAAIIGHVLPLQLRFRGGRGASTAFGAMFTFAPLAALATLALCFGLYLISRRQVASGVASFMAMPLLAWLTGSAVADVIAVGMVSAVLVTTHRRYLPEIVAWFSRTPVAVTEVVK